MANKEDDTARSNSATSRASRLWEDKILQSPVVKRITSIIGEKSPTAGSEKSRPTSKEWRMTLLRFGPLSGFFCMFLAIASIFASFGILAGSNHQPTANWSTPPSTYLAIFTAIANLSMRYAALQGVVIAWWVRAMKGSTLTKLHSNWRSGTSLLGALSAGRHMGLLGLACLFSNVVVIDGPLLQRSSTVVAAPFKNHPVTLDVSMVPEIPRYYTGGWATLEEYGDAGRKAVVDEGFNLTLPSPHGPIKNDVGCESNVSSSPLNAYFNNAPLRNVVRGCPGVCKAKLRAPALYAADCTIQTNPVDYKSPLPPNSTLYIAPPLTNEGFMIILILDTTGEYEAINMITAYATVKPAPDCTGILKMNICSLKSAIGEYDVKIQDGEAVLENAGSPRILAMANNSEVHRKLSQKYDEHPSTLGGILNTVFPTWQGNVYFYPYKGLVNGIVVGGQAYSRFTYNNVATECPSFLDPTDGVLESFNKMMVYVGASAALEAPSYLESALDPGLEVNYTTIGQLEGHHNVYSTHYWFFLGAILVEIVCIALVAPSYWGWWKIGRAYSFSPLEIAKAFQSPLLADCNSNSSGRELATEVGDFKVRYGVLEPAASHTSDEVELAFGDSASVVRPKQGMRFNV